MTLTLASFSSVFNKSSCDLFDNDDKDDNEDVGEDLGDANNLDRVDFIGEEIMLHELEILSNIKSGRVMPKKMIIAQVYE